MKEVRHIIVPVDFQQHTSELAAYALEMAAKLSASVLFLHVIEQAVFTADFVPVKYHLHEEELLTHAKKKMAALVEKSKKTYAQCDGQVAKGDVVDSILEYTAEAGIDLIIMATHGARGIDKILLGSVAERIIKRATKPVLVFRP
jgi:nucleotide-binding universal stress UspA family protein